ncbi:MAG TPA: glycosyltransferase family 2 protein [Nitrospirota bacterium]|nr:glycosyltransferase family 2 protein [Nitrospirota bacterium]
MSIAQNPEPIRISIITPSYNQGRFLSQTIESILSQEGDFTIDYIIIDGGSRDNSLEIIKKYEVLLIDGTWPIRCKGIRYRWLSEKDRGQTDALNKGFLKAEGDILAWLNSDDTYLPGALNLIASSFRNNPNIGLVYGKAWFIDESGKKLREVNTGPTDFQGLAALNLICQPAAFFRRSVLDAAGPMDVDLHYTMDHDLWIRMSRISRLLHIEHYLATYRMHGESKSMSPRQALGFQVEILHTVMKYYHWAPANRVFGLSYHRIRTMLPPALGQYQTLVTLLAIVYVPFLYIILNRGRIRMDDLRMLNRKNFIKVKRGEIDNERFLSGES